MISNDLFENDSSAQLTRVQLQVEEAKKAAFSAEDSDNSNVKLRSLWVSVDHAEQLHLRHFYQEDNQPCNKEELYADVNSEPVGSHELPGMGRSVFMLHGEAECGRVFYGSEQRGLAWYLAKQGYEVFVADLGARGRSLLSSGEQSALNVNDIITQAIPRLLQAAANHSSYSNGADVAQPDIWIGHGFGAVMLSAAWSRLDESLRSATQMVFLSARRRVVPERFSSRLFSKLLCHSVTRYAVRLLGGVPAKKLNVGSANENALWYQNYTQWLEAESWIDATDDFDYRAALKANPLPPVLHLAPRQATFYSSPDDTRHFVEELGTHNARLLFVDRNSQTGQPYNHLSMLLAAQAETDVFSDASIWLASVDAFDKNMQSSNAAEAYPEKHLEHEALPIDDFALTATEEQHEMESMHVDSDDRYSDRREAISFA
jgi:predicted alpha/beta hydrolase